MLHVNRRFDIHTENAKNPNTINSPTEKQFKNSAAPFSDLVGIMRPHSRSKTVPQMWLFWQGDGQFNVTHAHTGTNADTLMDT